MDAAEWTLEEEDEARMDVEMLLERVVDFETFPTMFRNLHENAEKNETKKDEMLREHLLSTSIDSTTANYAKVQNKMVPTSLFATRNRLYCTSWREFRSNRTDMRIKLCTKRIRTCYQNPCWRFSWIQRRRLQKHAKMKKRLCICKKCLARVSVHVAFDIRD